IGSRTMLLIVDDAWRPEDIIPFKVGGPNCAHLVTTRFPPIASQVAASKAMALSELDSQQGLSLLQHLAPQVVTKEKERAQTLVKLVGGLPLALTLIGNYLRVQSYTGQTRRVVAAFEHLSKVESRLRLQEPKSPAERHPSQPDASTVSLETI